MFLSTFEKQLDSKRRIVVPQEFRAASAGAFEGVFCFPSIEAECLDAGGQALFDQWNTTLNELDHGDPLRTALETCVFGGMVRLSFDTAGRIALPDALCEQVGIDDWVAIVGMRDRFQIWSRDAWRAHRAVQRDTAREGLAQFRRSQRTARAEAAK